MGLELEKNVRDLVAGHCVEMYVMVRVGVLYCRALSVMPSPNARFGQDDVVHGPWIWGLTKI
jgi:hypothetical protein